MFKRYFAFLFCVDIGEKQEARVIFSKVGYFLIKNENLKIVFSMLLCKVVMTAWSVGIEISEIDTICTQVHEKFTPLKANNLP